MTLEQTTSQGDRLASLKELASTLAKSIDECEQASLLPQLARQYRETMREIDEIQPEEDDDVEQIISDFEKVR